MVFLEESHSMLLAVNTTETPAALTYASVVSQDSVCIALTLDDFNGLDVLACDI